MLGWGLVCGYGWVVVFAFCGFGFAFWGLVWVCVLGWVWVFAFVWAGLVIG